MLCVENLEFFRLDLNLGFRLGIGVAVQMFEDFYFCFRLRCLKSSLFGRVYIKLFKGNEGV